MEPVDILKKEKEQLRRLDALRSKVYTPPFPAGGSVCALGGACALGGP